MKWTFKIESSSSSFQIRLITGEANFFFFVETSSEGDFCRQVSEKLRRFRVAICSNGSIKNQFWPLSISGMSREEKDEPENGALIKWERDVFLDKTKALNHPKLF